MKASFIVATMSSITALICAVEPLPETPHTPATATGKDFKLLDGFRMSLLAAEPLVTDPVAICYDADGRAYVAEMNDYPYTDKAQHKPMQENPTDKPIGKIRLLEDTNGDGKFDKSTIFASGLSWPTGVAPWKGGIYVTAAPDLWYFKDTDGDGKADVKEKVLTGYRKYNVQSEVNNPIWGLDNLIYIASSGNGGDVYSPSTGPDKAVNIGRLDIRLDPANGNTFELISGGGQFGNAFDDWGNRFLCSNSNPVRHVVLSKDDIERNPWLPSRQTTQFCPDPDEPIQLYPITAIEGWRLQRYKDRTFVPRKGYKPPRGKNAGDPSSPTSSSAGIVYRGDAYPESYRGSMYVTEPCYNLVFQLNRKADGATFVVTKPKSAGKADAIASTDVWFRPTNSVNAPDGCIHIVDLYREAIEHPWSLPEDFHARMDLERGRDKGRIYRLEPPEYKHRAAPKLSKASSADLVTLLAHRNAWHRETAQRLLFERQDKSVVASIRKLIRESKEPLGRLHALWILHGLGSLEEKDIALALEDSSPGVCANAAKLTAMFLPDHPALLERVIELADHSDPAVRFQVALALGAVNADDKSIAKALASIAKQDGSDFWSQLAVLSSSVPHAPAMLQRLLEDENFPGSASSVEILSPLARIVGAKNVPADTEALLAQLANRGEPDHITLATIGGLTVGLRSAKSSLLKIANKELVASVLAAARSQASNSKAPVAQRSNAIVLLRNGSFANYGAFLKGLLNPKEPAEIQSAAASAISIIGGKNPEVGRLLLDGWAGYSAELRNQVVQILLARTERLNALFDAVESGKVQPYQIGATRQELLINHKDPAISRQAKKAFSGGISLTEALAKYKEMDSLTGDPAKGEIVYQSICMACHKFHEKGVIDLGPNLAVISSWENERILTNIIDPNREVAPEFMEYIVKTKSGDVLTGRVVAESGSGITLRMPDNTKRDIPRQDITELQNTGRSLMPPGLNAAIPPQAMADLISFLRAGP